MRRAGISGWTSEPPADNYITMSAVQYYKKSINQLTEYAVEPVGVETVRPSA